MESTQLQSVRRARLKELISERFPGRGGQARLAAAIERQPDYISRCLSGKKGIGEDLARLIETKLCLPRLWMDGTPQENALSPRQLALLGLFEGLTESQQEDLMRDLQEKEQSNRTLFIELKKKLG
jgi:hypothetical protein